MTSPLHHGTGPMSLELIQQSVDELSLRLVAPHVSRGSA